MSRLGTMLVALAACGGEPRPAPDAGGTDAARETFLSTPCGDPTHADLPMLDEPFVSAYFDECSGYSDRTPLARFKVVARSPRACWRVAEERTSGWRVGDVFETTTDDRIGGFTDALVAAPGTLAFDVAMVTFDGVVGRQRVTIDAIGPSTVLELADAPIAIAVGDRTGPTMGDRAGPTVATESRLLVDGVWRDVPGVRAVASNDSVLVWIAVSGATAELVVADRSAIGRAVRTRLSGDPTLGVRLGLGSYEVAVVVGRTLALHRAERSGDGRLHADAIASITLEAPVDGLAFDSSGATVVITAGTLARFGSDLAPLAVDDRLRGATDLVPSAWHRGGYRTFARMGDDLVVMGAFTGTLAPLGDTRIAIDARIGRPLAVTGDGRVMGTLGMARGAADLEGPDFAPAEQAFGGEVGLSSLDGREIGWTYAVVPGESANAIVRVGGDTPGGCTL